MTDLDELILTAVTPDPVAKLAKRLTFTEIRAQLPTFLSADIAGRVDTLVRLGRLVAFEAFGERQYGPPMGRRRKSAAARKDPLTLGVTPLVRAELLKLACELGITDGSDRVRLGELMIALTDPDNIRRLAHPK